MFDLERHERIIIIFLVATLVLGLGVMAYKMSHSKVLVEIRHSDLSLEAGKSSEAHILVNINTATAAELEKLKGVGPSLAGRIIEYRQKSGLFLSKEDIKKVKGIGESLFSKFKDEITTE
jgi:comEA protein